MGDLPRGSVGSGASPGRLVVCDAAAEAHSCLDGLVAALGCLALVVFPIHPGGRLGLQARYVGQALLDQLLRLSVSAAVNGRDFTHERLNRDLVERAFAVRGLCLLGTAIEITHDFDDRQQIAGFDLGLATCGVAGCLGALDRA